MPMRSWARRWASARRRRAAGVKGEIGKRIGDALGMARMPDFAGGALHQVGVGGPGCILPSLNRAQRIEIVHRALFASGKNDAPAATFASIAAGNMHIDEGAQAGVLAIAAARLFTARGGITDAADGLQAYETGGASLAP